eukprot:15434146-Alexandrium_andersonii.AAC.1
MAKCPQYRFTQLVDVRSLRFVPTWKTSPVKGYNWFSQVPMLCDTSMAIGASANQPTKERKNDVVDAQNALMCGILVGLLELMEAGIPRHPWVHFK